MTTGEWIDVSVPLRTGVVHWPDNPPVSIERTQEIEDADGAPARAVLRSVESTAK
jgi:arylformamidase